MPTLVIIIEFTLAAPVCARTEAAPRLLLGLGAAAFALADGLLLDASTGGADQHQECRGCGEQWSMSSDCQKMGKMRGMKWDDRNRGEMNLS